jgi:hypothetical protein
MCEFALAPLPIRSQPQIELALFPAFFVLRMQTRNGRPQAAVICGSEITATLRLKEKDLRIQSRSRLEQNDTDINFPRVDDLGNHVYVQRTAHHGARRKINLTLVDRKSGIDSPCSYRYTGLFKHLLPLAV